MCVGGQPVGSGLALHCHVMVSRDHMVDGRGRSAFTLTKRTCFCSVFSLSSDAFSVLFMQCSCGFIFNSEDGERRMRCPECRMSSCFECKKPVSLTILLKKRMEQELLKQRT